ncbi:MAG TPA: TlpA disulfide reductase family protein [Telluria sp.]|nr:TlpA disulfide reductase family protein [Telluria sp.]
MNSLMNLSRLRVLVATFALVFATGAAAELKVGEAPPDYVGETLDGTPVLISQHAGKAIVLSYWATWCKYCLDELPILHNIQQKVGAERINVIAINTEDEDTFRDAKRILKKLSLFHGFDPDRKGRDAYGVKGLPFMVVIGRDGKVVAIHRGYSKESLPGIVADINRAIAAE